MAFPSATGTKPDDLHSAWNTIRGFASTVKAKAQEVKDASLAGDFDASKVIELIEVMALAVERWEIAVAVPGIGAYVKNQLNDQTIDIAAEYVTMKTQVDATIAWINTNFPKDGSGYLLYEKFDAFGNRTMRKLTPVQTATLRTQINALLATID